MRYRSIMFITATLAAVVGCVVATQAEDGDGQSRPSPNSPPLSEKEALAELKQFGGVLVHYDDRKPNRPVIAVDFTNHPGFQEPWLKPLGAFPQLSTLGLAGTRLTDAGMRYLKQLTELETLILSQTKITDEGLAELLRLKKLRYLDVRGTGVTGAGVTALRRFLPELEVALGPMPTMDTPAGRAESPPENPNSAAPATISVAKINELREKAAALSQPVEGQEEPQGWSKSRVDPGKLVELFSPLRLRKGYVLRAYVFREEGNGNGVVWAMPEGADFPAPKDCPTLENHLLKAPKPWDALDDPMEAIEGDGSAWSYLAASLLRRELREFGAMWHGCNWGTHFLLDNDPWKDGPPSEGASPLERPTSNADQWKWLGPRPAEWGPQVRMENGQVTVTFYTYSGLEKQAIYRHTDTYRAGKYRAKVEQEKIAEGPEGYLF